MTATESEAASYEFTTLTCIPGVIEYKGASIQLLDLPGIIEGAAQGKGRGRQVCCLYNIQSIVFFIYKLVPPCRICSALEEWIPWNIFCVQIFMLLL